MYERAYLLLSRRNYKHRFNINVMYIVNNSLKNQSKTIWYSKCICSVLPVTFTVGVLNVDIRDLI